MSCLQLFSLLRIYFQNHLGSLNEYKTKFPDKVEVLENGETKLIRGPKFTQKSGPFGTHKDDFAYPIWKHGRLDLRVTPKYFNWKFYPVLLQRLTQEIEVFQQYFGNEDERNAALEKGIDYMAQDQVLTFVLRMTSIVSYQLIFSFSILRT